MGVEGYWTRVFDEQLPDQFDIPKSWDLHQYRSPAEGGPYACYQHRRSTRKIQVYPRFDVQPHRYVAQWIDENDPSIHGAETFYETDSRHQHGPRRRPEQQMHELADAVCDRMAAYDQLWAIGRNR